MAKLTICVTVSIVGSAGQDEMKALDNKGSEVNAKMKELYGKYNEAKNRPNLTEQAQFGRNKLIRWTMFKQESLKVS